MPDVYRADTAFQNRNVAVSLFEIQAFGGRSHAPVTNILDMLLYTTEMNVQFVEVFKQCTKRCALSHLGKSINILGEAFAAITKFTIRTGDIGMGVVDIEALAFQQ